MLFDVQAALAEILSEAPPHRDSCDSRDSSPPESRESQSQPRRSAKLPEVLPFAPPPSAEPSKGVVTNPIPSRDEGDAFRHGRSETGGPLTWTGRVVSLDEWRKLSAWERHGPDGRLFCGICQQWVSRFPDCHGDALTAGMAGASQ